MITARTLAETPDSKRRHADETAVDPFAKMRAAIERWQHAREREFAPCPADLPAEHEESAPRVFL